MKTSIRLEALFPLEEQLEIVGTIGAIKQKYDEEKIPKTRRHYFRQLAHIYNLGTRVSYQMEAYHKKLLNKEELTTNEDLSKIFGVERSTISRYLEKYISPEDFKDRIDLLRRTGAANGGSNSSTRGYKQKRTWSRKKK